MVSFDILWIFDSFLATNFHKLYYVSPMTAEIIFIEYYLESRNSAEEKMEHEIEMVSFFYSDLTYAKAVSGVTFS